MAALTRVDLPIDRRDCGVTSLPTWHVALSLHFEPLCSAMFCTLINSTQSYCIRSTGQFRYTLYSIIILHAYTWGQTRPPSDHLGLQKCLFITVNIDMHPPDHSVYTTYRRGLFGERISFKTSSHAGGAVILVPRMDYLSAWE